VTAYTDVSSASSGARSAACSPAKCPVCPHVLHGQILACPITDEETGRQKFAGNPHVVGKVFMSRFREFAQCADHKTFKAPDCAVTGAVAPKPQCHQQLAKADAPVPRNIAHLMLCPLVAPVFLSLCYERPISPNSFSVSTPSQLPIGPSHRPAG
jgi:hypothetical protein